MKTWVERYQAVMKGGCTIKIHLWLGNAIVVCETDLPEDLQFDFIDTSNIADKVGLILLLLHCQEKLKHPNGVLRTESFFWNKVVFISVKNFLCQCLDIPVSYYPTMIGLHLAEELTLGHEELLPTYGNDVRSKLTLRWTAAIAKDTITKLRVLTDGTDAVSKTVYALENHTKLDKIPTTALDLNYTGNKIYRRLMELGEDSTAGDEYFVVEFPDYYSVIISTEPDGSENGAFKVGIVDGDPQVVMLQCIEKGITVRLHLACSISLNSTRFISREDGTVECRLIKNSDLIAGERVLPWKKLDVSTVAELADFPQSKYRGSTLKTYTSRMWITDATCELMPPERQLAHIVEFIFGASSSIKIKSSKPSGKTTNIILQLECLKIYENKPTMFLSYFDFDKAKHLVSQKKMNNEEFQIAYKNFEHACVEMDAPSPREMKEGYELLVKMMEINSYRMTQDQPEDKRWILKTFVRGRYPYTDQNTFCKTTSLAQLFATLGMGQKAASRTTSDSGAASSSNLKQLCANCGKTSPDCKKCARCNKVSYCGKACQKKAWSVHKGVCKEEENKHSLPSCAYCGKTSPDCKKCARCNKVSYCGKACQKKAWSVHKGVCKEEENKHSLPSCANCGKTSPDCKKCARCNKVSYCDKACQKKAWSVHKGVCKSEGN
ncbi:uncharacterized protein LOC124143033 isoform X1 [Haliotis rufescens]|uniref:uncharacterized protein LOC124143033 isoform X1 n=1 Tax=Haliotis rufescens TaxID=6454 RepID=UPI00201F30B1|nr:uncharacterized protein LOC124143033 isoform X1 [Haliotis rufescens]XP_048238044.1 uncharacterized protein LOC124143033 isoform X1 [Haliotis rufescens]